MQKFKFTLKPWQTATLIFLIAVVTTLFSVAIQPGAFTKSLYDIVTRPLCIVLNGFPVLILVCLGYFVCGNVFFGASVTSLISLLLSYVNLLKTEGRDDAFVPADLGLIREGFSSAANYGIDMHVPLLVLIIVYCVLLFALGFFVKSPRFKLLWRGVSAAVTVLVFTLSVRFVYTSTELYNSFTVPQMYNIPSVFNTLGFNYCFLRNFNLYPVDKPEGYKPSQVEQWQKESLLPKGEREVSPNVIMVMGESFSDFSNEDVFDWGDPQQNPAYKYNLLTESDRSISGHIIVSNIAAGTANTEFDILTGMPTNMISETTTSSFRVVNKKTPTVASVLKDSGYATSFLHPGDSWFYNRSSVYKYFGVEDQVFNESFDLQNDTVGGLVTDEAFLRELKEKMSQNTSPQFIYSVTIQNHQTYTYAKYPDATPDVPTNVEISDTAMENLSVYLRGVRDTSEMVYELAQYIDTLDEPTILVFFGDHLPNLGDNFGAYRELGLSVGLTDTPENTLSAYKTPFVIYGNTSYCETVDFEQKAKDLELAPVINNNYLGAAVLELAGFEGHDPYFDFLNTVRRDLPVFRVKEGVYCFSDGSYSNSLTDDTHKDIIKKIDWWEYYRLRTK